MENQEIMDQLMENRQNYMMDNNSMQHMNVNVASAGCDAVVGVHADVVSGGVGGVAGEILGVKYDEHHEEHDVGDDDELKYVKEVQQSEKQQQQQLQALKNFGLDDDGTYENNELAEKEVTNSAAHEFGNGDGGFVFGGDHHQHQEHQQHHDLFNMGNGHDSNGHDNNQINEDFCKLISPGFEEKLNMMDSEIDGFKNEGDFSSMSVVTETVEGFVPQVDVKIETKSENQDMVDEEEPSSLATNTTNGTSSLSENVPPQAVIAPQANAFDDFMANLENKENSDFLTQRPNELDLEQGHSQLNPDAKEFIPSFGSNPASPTSLFATCMDQTEPVLSDAMETQMYFGQPPTAVPRHLIGDDKDDFVARSPRKGKGDSNVDIDTVSLPQMSEFEQEADKRPHEVLPEDVDGFQHGDEVMTPDQAIQQLPLDDQGVQDKENQAPVDSIDFQSSGFMDHGPETSVDLDIDLDLQPSSVIASLQPEEDVMKRSIYVASEDAIKDVLNSVQPIPSEIDGVNDSFIEESATESAYVANDDAIKDVLNSVQPIPYEIDGVNNSFTEESATESAANQLAGDKELLQVEEKEHVSHSPSTEEIQMNLQNTLNSSNKDIPQIPIDMDNADNMQESMYMEQEQESQQHEQDKEFYEKEKKLQEQPLLQVEEKHSQDDLRQEQLQQHHEDVAQYFGDELQEEKQAEQHIQHVDLHFQEEFQEEKRPEQIDQQEEKLQTNEELQNFQERLQHVNQLEEEQQHRFQEEQHHFQEEQHYFQEEQHHLQEEDQHLFKQENQSFEKQLEEPIQEQLLEEPKLQEENKDELLQDKSDTHPIDAAEESLLADNTNSLLANDSFLDISPALHEQQQEIHESFSPCKISDEVSATPTIDSLKFDMPENQEQTNLNDVVMTPSYTADEKHLLEETKEQQMFSMSGLEQQMSEMMLNNSDGHLSQAEEVGATTATTAIEDISENLISPDEAIRHDQYHYEQEPESTPEQMLVDDSFNRHEQECLEQHEQEQQLEQAKEMEVEQNQPAETEHVVVHESIESPIEQQHQPDLESEMVAVEEPVMEAKQAAPLFATEETEIVNKTKIEENEENLEEKQELAPFMVPEEKSMEKQEVPHCKVPEEKPEEISELPSFMVPEEKHEETLELPPCMVPETAPAELLEPPMTKQNETENIKNEVEEEKIHEITVDEINAEIVKETAVEEEKAKEEVNAEQEVIETQEVENYVPVEAAAVAATAVLAATATVVAKSGDSPSKTKTETAKKPLAKTGTNTAAKPKVGSTPAAKKPVEAAKKPLGSASKPRTAPAKPATTTADKKPIAKTATTTAARKPLSATTTTASKVVSKTATSTTTTRTATAASKATTTTTRPTTAPRTVTSTTSTTRKPTATSTTTNGPSAKSRPATAPAKPTTLGLSATNGAPKTKPTSPRAALTSQVRKTAPATTGAKSPVKSTATNGVTKTASTTMASRTKTSTSTVSSTAGKTFTARPAPKFTSSSSTTTTTTTTRRLTVGGTTAASTTTTTTKTSSTPLRKSSPTKTAAGRTPTKSTTSAGGMKSKTPITKPASPPAKPAPIRKPVDKTIVTSGDATTNKELNGTAEQQQQKLAFPQNGDLLQAVQNEQQLNGDSSIPMPTEEQQQQQQLLLETRDVQIPMDLINA